MRNRVIWHSRQRALNLIGQKENACGRAGRGHQLSPPVFVIFMGLTYVAAEHPMAQPVGKGFSDSPNPTTMHHQYEPRLIISQKILIKD